MPDYFHTSQFQLLLGVTLAALLGFLFARSFPRFFRLVMSLWDRWSGLVIVVLGLSVLVCGSIGFSQKEGSRAESIPAALYETLQVFAFNVDADELESSPLLMSAMVCAMLLAVTVAAQGIFFLFRDSYARLQLLGVSGHIVVCGLGRIGRQLVADLADSADRRLIVVLEPDDQNPNLNWARERGAIVIAGDATKRESLEEVGVHRADEVFLVTGSDECNIESVIELRDILAARGRRRIFGGTRPPLRCFVHVLNRDLAGVLRHRSHALGRDSIPAATTAAPPEQSPAAVASDAGKLFDVQVFNALERTARRLLEEIATSTCNGQPMRPRHSREVAHYVMLGFGEFGQTLALQLAELAHFENSRRLRLTIVDQEIDRKALPFIARHPRFGPDFGQIEAWSFDPEADDWSSKRYQPVPAAQLPQDSMGIAYACNAQYVEYTEATADDFLQGLNSAFRADGVKPAILVCFEEDRRNFALAERLKLKLQTLGWDWPIFVWIPRQRELSQLLNDQRSRFERERVAPIAGQGELIPFGQCYGSVSYTEVTAAWSEWLARQLHLIWLSPDEPGWHPDVARLQSALDSQNPAEELARLDWLDWAALDAAAEQAWIGCEEWKRASNRSAAIHAVIKAAALGWRVTGLADPAASGNTRESADSRPVPDAELFTNLLRMEHYRWVAERLIAGWRYGPERDETRRVRWQITPWDGLDHPPPGTAPNRQTTEKQKDLRIVNFVLGLILAGKLAVRPIPIDRPGTPSPAGGSTS